MQLSMPTIYMMMEGTKARRQTGMSHMQGAKLTLNVGFDALVR